MPTELSERAGNPDAGVGRVRAGVRRHGGCFHAVSSSTRAPRCKCDRVLFSTIQELEVCGGVRHGVRDAQQRGAFFTLPDVMLFRTRRVCAALAGSYVDDFTVVDVLAGEGTGQLCTQKVVECCGWTLSKEKHTSWRPQRGMLGVHVRLDAARSSGKVTFEPKTETVQKICALSTHHLQLQS